MKKITKIVVAFIIIWATYLGHSYILSLITPEMSETNASLIQTGALSLAFVGTTIYWKWLKLLKKFKWNPDTQEWYQVLEPPR